MIIYMMIQKIHLLYILNQMSLLILHNGCCEIVKEKKERDLLIQFCHLHLVNIYLGREKLSKQGGALTDFEIKYDRIHYLPAGGDTGGIEADKLLKNNPDLEQPLLGALGLDVSHKLLIQNL